MPNPDQNQQDPWAVVSTTPTAPTAAPTATPAPADATAPAKDPWAVVSTTPAPPVDNLGRFQGAADVGHAVIGALSGVGGAAIESVQGLKNLVNKVLPQGAQIPDIPIEYRQNITPAEKAGGFVENVGEFMAGDELLKGAVKGVGLFEKMPAALRALAEAHPKTFKTIIGSVGGATVGGTQGAVKGAAEDNAASGAEGGAIGGGIGGAVGGATEALSDAASSGVKTVKKILGFGGLSGEEALTKAGRPNVNEGKKFAQALDTAAPRIVEAAKDVKLKTVGDFEDLLHDTAQNIRTKEFQPMIDRHADEIISAKPIQDNIKSAVTRQMTKYAPEQAKEINDFAKQFTDIPLSEAEQDLQYFNAELKGYYRQGAVDQAAKLKTAGTVAKYEAAADGLRDSIYGKLRELGENAPEDLQRQYGALKTLERIFGKRATVADRQNPLNLPQVLGLTEGAAALLSGHPVVALAGAVPTITKMRNAPESLIRQGVKAMGKDTAAKAPGVISKGVQEIAPVAGAQIGQEVEQ